MDPLEYLYEAYRGEVYRYLVSLTRDPQIAEELLSDTFCAAVQALAGFRKKSEVKTWLLTIARNKWYDHLRRRRIAPTQEQLARMYLADAMPGPEELVWKKMTMERLRKLLAQEDARTRQILQMRMEGYSFHEIGQALGIREGSARVADFRARKRLREKLLEEGYDGAL